MLGECFHQENRFFVVWDNSSLMVLVHLGVGLGNFCSLKSWGDLPTDNEEFEVPTSKTLWFFGWFSSLFRDCTSYWASFEFPKNAYLTVSIYEKMLIVQFPFMIKCLNHNFHLWNNVYHSISNNEKKFILQFPYMKKCFFYNFYIWKNAYPRVFFKEISESMKLKNCRTSIFSYMEIVG